MNDLLVSREGPVLRVTLNRPERRNALSRAALAELRETFSAHAKDAAIKLAVLTGAGELAFAAGGDLKDLAKVRSPPDARRMSCEAVAALESVRAFPGPVIAGLNGLAIGGGAELAVACDFRVAARHARIGFVQGKLNIGPAFGGGTLLVDLLGARRAHYALATCRVFTAREALAFGLVDAVARPGETLDAAVKRFAKPILAQQPQVLRAFKALALAARESRALRKRIELERFVEGWVHPDHWAAADRVLPRGRARE